MRFFQSSSKSKSNKELINSEYIDQEDEVNVFSASFEKEKNLLKFHKEDDLFVAVYSKSKIAAVIDGQTMNFLRSS